MIITIIYMNKREGVRKRSSETTKKNPRERELNNCFVLEEEGTDRK